MSRYARVQKFVSEFPWAVLPATLDIIVEIMELRAEGRAFTDEEIQARVGAPRRRMEATHTSDAGATVAVIPVHGVIAPRMNVMTEMSGGTSADVLGRQIGAAMTDPHIDAVVLDVDSPGGSVFGIQELADSMAAMKGRKPMVAVANHVMASAAYWIGSQADEIIASPSSQVGSIGVIAVHQDVSGAEEKLGVKTTMITAGKHKAAGDPHSPLSEDARAMMQGLVDQYYTAFVKGVARGRGVSAADVRGGFAEGAIVGASDAVKLGLADSVGTLDDAISRLASGSKSVSARANAIIFDERHQLDGAVLLEQAKLREALAARAR